MKSSAAVQIEGLREEVARLNDAVAELEARLDVQDSNVEEDPWNIWPYSWAISGYHQSVAWMHSVHEKQARRLLERQNRRRLNTLSGAAPAGELKLI